MKERINKNDITTASTINTLDTRRLIVHIVYRFDTGGLENGLVNLINHLPCDQFQHHIVSLTESVPSFCARITTNNVSYTDFHKAPGHAWRLYPRLYRLLRTWRPDIVHTRGLAALETMVVASLAGVRIRIHGEHGWDALDPGGIKKKYQWLRRFYRPFVTHYIALSSPIQQYLVTKIGIPAAKIKQIFNGVDTHRFHPATNHRDQITGCPFTENRFTIIGTVGRLYSIKNPLHLVRAFAWVIEQYPQYAETARLVIVGDGPLRAALADAIAQWRLQHLVWCAGERDDIPHIMRGLDLFVLPSNAEGISNTILEAMATGLPVVATRVGGNAELVVENETGQLVEPEHQQQLGQALVDYLSNPERMAQHGQAGRARVVKKFSIKTMVNNYTLVYKLS
jgi:sugar transferase (PEP-CTERM/EpsH1 system associated)